MKKEYHPFRPIVFKNSKFLILGTFPSIKSFENSFYYSNPKNQFWKIMQNIFDMPTDTKKDKINLIKKNNLALWDIVKSCNRKNSSDSNLKNVTVNDIEELLKKYKNIKALLFTSKKAVYFYEKYHKKLNIPIYYLPSPSPAYALLNIEEKTKIYKEIFLKVNQD